MRPTPLSIDMDELQEGTSAIDSASDVWDPPIAPSVLEAGLILGARRARPPWNPEEDVILLHHVAKHGTKNWGSLKANGLLPNRDQKACCNRFILLKRRAAKGGLPGSLSQVLTRATQQEAGWGSFPGAFSGGASSAADARSPPTRSPSPSGLSERATMSALQILGSGDSSQHATTAPTLRVVRKFSMEPSDVLLQSLAGRSLGSIEWGSPPAKRRTLLSYRKSLSTGDLLPSMQARAPSSRWGCSPLGLSEARLGGPPPSGEPALEAWLGRAVRDGAATAGDLSVAEWERALGGRAPSSQVGTMLPPEAGGGGDSGPPLPRAPPAASSPPRGASLFRTSSSTTSRSSASSSSRHVSPHMPTTTLGQAQGHHPEWNQPTHGGSQQGTLLHPLAPPPHVPPLHALQVADLTWAASSGTTLRPCVPPPSAAARLEDDAFAREMGPPRRGLLAPLPSRPWPDQDQLQPLHMYGRPLANDPELSSLEGVTASSLIFPSALSSYGAAGYGVLPSLPPDGRPHGGLDAGALSHMREPSPPPASPMDSAISALLASLQPGGAAAAGLGGLAVGGGRHLLGHGWSDALQSVLDVAVQRQLQQQQCKEGEAWGGQLIAPTTVDDAAAAAASGMSFNTHLGTAAFSSGALDAGSRNSRGSSAVLALLQRAAGGSDPAAATQEAAARRPFAGAPPAPPSWQWPDALLANFSDMTAFAGPAARMAGPAVWAPPPPPAASSVSLSDSSAHGLFPGLPGGRHQSPPPLGGDRTAAELARVTRAMRQAAGGTGQPGRGEALVGLEGLGRGEQAPSAAGLDPANSRWQRGSNVYQELQDLLDLQKGE